MCKEVHKQPLSLYHPYYVVVVCNLGFCHPYHLWSRVKFITLIRVCISDCLTMHVNFIILHKIINIYLSVNVQSELHKIKIKIVVCLSTNSCYKVNFINLPSFTKVHISIYCLSRIFKAKHIENN